MEDYAIWHNMQTTLNDHVNDIVMDGIIEAHELFEIMGRLEAVGIKADPQTVLMLLQQQMKNHGIDPYDKNKAMEEERELEAQEREAERARAEEEAKAHAEEHARNGIGDDLQRALLTQNILAGLAGGLGVKVPENQSMTGPSTSPGLMTDKSRSTER